MAALVSRRRVLALASGSGLLAAGAVLAACGAATTTGNNGTAAGTSAPSQASTTRAAGSAGVAVTTSQAAKSSILAPSVSASAAAPAAPVRANGVLFWQWGHGYVPGFNKLADTFNQAQKDVVVTHENPASQPDYWNKIITLQAGGQGPDVFEINNTSSKNWAHNGSVADVSAYASRDKAVSAALQDTYPAMVDWYTYKGKLMGLPWDFSAGTVMYNLDLFRETSIKPINELGKQWDWNMMKDYASRLTKKNGAAQTRSGIWINQGTENGWYSFCVANGASFFNETLDKCTIASDPAIAGLDFVLGMLKSGVAATTSFKSATHSQIPSGGTAFTAGLTAMDFEGDWNFTTYEQSKGFTNWDAGIFPYSPTTGKTANTSNLRGLVMNPVSRKKDLAWQWMSYLKSNAVQDQIPILFGEIPSTRSSAQKSYMDPAKGGPPAGRNFLGPDLDATVPLPASDLLNSTEVSKAYSPIIDKAYKLELTAADALAQVQQAINGMLAAAKH